MSRVKAVEGQTIYLGLSGENEATEIVFDISDLLTEYPQGHCELLVRKPYVSQALPVPVVQTENEAVWTVTDSDLVTDGNGEAQLLFYSGNVCKRRNIYKTFIDRSLGNMSGDVSKPDGWINDVVRIGADARKSADEAEASAIRAEQAADRVESGGSGGGSGKPGGNGLSAYELAVQQGFVGTLDEWLASLKGEPGKDGTGQGMSQEQITALDEMFKVCAYKETPTSQYEAFKKAFGIENVVPPIPDPEPEVPVEKTYTVTNTLTNAKNSNGITSIKEKTAYTAKLTADEGYTLEGANISITMGGANITSTAYSNGNIDIESVTGNVVITASAVKVEIPPAPSKVDVDLTGKFDMDGYYYDPNSAGITSNNTLADNYSKGMSSPVKLIPKKKYTLITILPIPFGETWLRCGVVANNADFPKTVGGSEMRTDKPQNLNLSAKAKFEDVGMIKGVKHAKITFTWTAPESPLYLFFGRSTKVEDSDCSLSYEEVM